MVRAIKVVNKEITQALDAPAAAAATAAGGDNRIAALFSAAR